MTGPALLPMVRRWWRLLAGAALVAALGAWIFAATAGKTYQATTKLLVGPVSGDYPTLQASGALGRTYAELARGRGVVRAAAGAVGVRLTDKQLENAVTASSNDITRIVEVDVRYGKPAAAARLADAVAAQLMRLQRQASPGTVEAILGDPGVAALPRAQQKAVRAAVTKVVGSQNPGSIELVEGALVPKAPVSPKVGLLVLLGALAGLLAAAVYATTREGMAEPGAEAETPYVELGAWADGNGGDGADRESEVDIERWLGEVRGGERT